MKYYLVAGEASGDLHGANLMKALKATDPDAVFRFWGGDLMLGEGGTLVKHYAQMAFMGFVEVVANLRTIFRNLSLCKNDISHWKPDVLILIDFPGFNLKVAEYAKAQGFLVCYYISPKVWAWNQKRVLKIKKIVDHLFCILPFEVDFYRQWDMKVDYVGNPLLDAVSSFTPDESFLEKNNLTGQKIVALLPGSRKQEISRLLPDMLAVAKQFSGYQFVIAGAPSFDQSYYQQYMQDQRVPVLFHATYDILSHAEAAVVASGTATLETALFNVPQVVIYKGNSLTIAIARLLVKIKFISLVNLIVDRGIVKELIQQDCNPGTIGEELKRLLKGETYRSQMLRNYDELDAKMGEAGASARTARLITQYAAKK